MPKFLEVTDKQAALAALGVKEYFVDNYGADPTGATSSNTAVTAALAAMGTDPGVLRFGQGTYALSTTITLGPFQSVIGQSRSATVLDYSGTSSAIRVRDTRPFTGGGSDASSANQLWQPGGVSGPSAGGCIADLTIKGTGAGSNTCGLHIGDVLAPKVSISVFDFDESGCKGIWFDNRFTWCEFADVEARIVNCKEAVVFSINGEAGQTSPPPGFPVDWYNGLKSFGYGRYDLYILSFANQTGVRMTDAVLYNMAEFRLTGGFINNESPGGNTGKVLHLTGDAIFDSSPLIAVESGGSGPRHQTIVREDNAAMYGRNCFLLFLGQFANGSGPWSTLVLSGYVNVDNLIGKHGASQHAHRVLGGITGTKGALENGTWFFMSGNWFAATLASGNTNFTVYDYPEPTPVGNQGASYDLFLTQPASGGAGTVTWPGSFVWAGGEAPTLSTTNGAVDWIHVETPDFVTFYASHMTSRRARLTSIKAPSGNTVLNFIDSGSNNYLNVYNGGSPIIETVGSDANINMYHAVKGAGRFYFNPGTGQSSCQIFTEGSATDINFDLYPQGSGRVRQAGTNIPTVSSTDTLTNKTISGADNTLSNIAQSSVTSLTTDLAGKVPTTRTVNSKQLSADVTLTQDDVGSGITNKVFTATEQTKLAGIATGATANSADATLLARANHTGTQLASTISDFSTAADARVTAKTVGHNWFQPGYVSGNYYLCNSYQSTNTSAAQGNNTVRVSPWIVTADITITKLFAEFTVAGEANSVYRIGIWNHDATTGKPGSLVLDAGTISTGTGDAGDVDTGGTPGVYEITVSQTLSAGAYWVGGAVQGAATTQPTMRANNGLLTMWPIGTSLPSAGYAISAAILTGQSGAFGSLASATTSGLGPVRIGFKVS